MTIKNVLFKYEIKDHDALNKYLNLVSVPESTDVYTEKHHICPVSLFPEFKNSDWNLVTLSLANHIEAHRLLCLIYKNNETKRAYSFMSRISTDEKIKHLTSDAYSGDSNPAKRPEVRKKISQAKLGKPRNDLKGKSYFGADSITITNGIKAMSEKLKGTVVVKDINGNKFRVPVNDQRYLNGELVSVNKGVSRPNSASKRPEVIKSIMTKRAKTYEKFSKFTFDEMVDFLYDSSKSGKNIFAVKALFSKNYSGYVKRTKFDPQALYDSVVQRLSKG